MSHDLIHPTEHQLPIDDISSSISDEIFEFCDLELFSDTLQKPKISSCSDSCYEENLSYSTYLCQPNIEDNLNSYQNNTNGINTNTTSSYTTTTASTSTTDTSTNTTTNNTSYLSIIFDSQDETDNDISASIDFSPSSTFPLPSYFSVTQDQYDFSTSVQPEIPFAADSVVNGGLPYYPSDQVPPFIRPQLPLFSEDHCSSLLGQVMGAYMPGETVNGDASFGASHGSMFMGSELIQQELDYNGESGGIYSSDLMHRIFNPGDFQAMNETQQLVAGADNTTLVSEITILEDSTYKVGKLSAEQRKEKIHRYMKKRNERNFSKKIKYACRKTLADSRPRVRGRFAKNDELGDASRAACSNHEEEDYEEVHVKEEDEMVESSDIFAHISGVNSFKCNFPIQSWI